MPGNLPGLGPRLGWHTGASPHRAWGRLREYENAEAYTRRTMYHPQVSWWRRSRVAESLTGEPPEPRPRGGGAADPAAQTALRLTLRQALPVAEIAEPAALRNLQIVSVAG